MLVSSLDIRWKREGIELIYDSQSGSAPQQGQPAVCGEVNLPSRYPWIAPWKPMEVRGNRWASVAVVCTCVCIYIGTLCRNTSKGGSVPPPRSQAGSTIQRVTCPPKRERTRNWKSSRWWNGRRITRSMRMTRRGDCPKETYYSYIGLEKIKYPLRVEIRRNWNVIPWLKVRSLISRRRMAVRINRW